MTETRAAPTKKSQLTVASCRPLTLRQSYRQVMSCCLNCSSVVLMAQREEADKEVRTEQTERQVDR
ncbi:hypothetical protein LDENG_00287710 [Lucifuga dentata]|nr:hypothetical protein LDENG_00287710 [Lucifuga dentata]